MNQQVLNKARVYFKDDLAGSLSETNDGYVFQYDMEFLRKNIPISVSLPLRKEPYYSEDLFPFFKGLLPEGWYLAIVSATQKVDSSNFFEILSSTASVGTIGAVTIQKDT